MIEQVIMPTPPGLRWTASFAQTVHISLMVSFDPIRPSPCITGPRWRYIPACIHVRASPDSIYSRSGHNTDVVPHISHSQTTYLGDRYGSFWQMTRHRGAAIRLLCEMSNVESGLHEAGNFMNKILVAHTRMLFHQVESKLMRGVPKYTLRAAIIYIHAAAGNKWTAYPIESYSTPSPGAFCGKLTTVLTSKSTC